MMILRRMLFSLLVAILLLTLTGPVALAQDTTPQPPVWGAINIIVPDVFITPVDGGDEIRLPAPSSFDAGETLRTSESGTALITWFYDGTETIVGQESRVTLNSFSGPADQAYVIDMELHAGHIAGALGPAATEGRDPGMWAIKTPAFTVYPLSGQFDLTVTLDGETRLIVTEGAVDVLAGEAPAFTVDAGQYLVGAPGVTEAISTDGVSPTAPLIATGICTASTPANLNVRSAANEDSRRLGGVPAGQILWVRASTGGNLWLQVYYATDPDDITGHNFGWVYGPAVELNADSCGGLLRAALDARMNGGPGVDQAGTPADSSSEGE